MDPLILYHGDQDGFCSAFLLWLVMDGRGEYQSVQYGQEAPTHKVEGRNVYVVDFSYQRPDLLLMKQRAKSLVVLDHHKTAEGEIGDLSFCTFNMNRSGAGLTWDLVEEEIRERLGRRQLGVHSWVKSLVDYVEDYDLWKWSLPHSKEINAAIRSHRFDFNIWKRVFVRDWLSQARTEGEGILRMEVRMVDKSVRNAQVVSVGEHRVPAVNSSVLQSEIGARLARGNKFGVVWFQRADGKFQYSLRSQEGGVDVSEVAKEFGGGGHERSAGFESERLLWYQGQ
ncbi:MAG TPA: DHHA1 domain-containing protein [Anaerolineae bacterium]|nr:DHHA1 domain-containing protein [Anaerolineae bacterium]